MIVINSFAIFSWKLNYIYVFTVSCIVLTNGFVDVFSTKVSVGVFVNYVYSNILGEVMRSLAGLRMRVVE